MRYFIENKPTPFMWFSALAGAVIAVGATRIIDFDLWWHLKSGEVICLWRQIPRIDIFSYTAAGAEWMNGEWLYQVLAWLLYSNFGIASLTVLKLALAAGISLAFFKTLRKLDFSHSASSWALIILLFGIADRFADRPFLFSTLFIAIFCLSLHSFTSGRKKWLWELPILQILWINLHGGGTFGPQLVFAFALGESLQCYFGGEVLDRRRLKHLWLVGLASTAACMINPFGIDAILFSLAVFHKMPDLLRFTQEWILPLDPRLDGVISQIIFRAILVIVLASYAVNRKGAKFSHLALTALTALLAIRGRRFTADFILVNLPIIFVNLRTIAQRVQRSPGGGHSLAWGNLAIVFLLSLAALSAGVPATIHGGRNEELGFGASSRYAPARLVDFLEENRIHGRSFNEMAVGGYLIFRRWPGERVFIDGRTPVYGNDYYKEIVDALQLPQNFDELDRKHSFDYLVFRASEAWDLRHLHRHLWENPKWKLIYADPTEGYVYVRDEPKFADLIKRFAVRKHPVVDYMRRLEMKVASGVTKAE